MACWLGTSALVLLGSALLVSGAATVVKSDRTGSVLRLNGEPYYVTTAPSFFIESPATGKKAFKNYSPATSIRSQFSPITKKFLESQLSLFSRVDDVWNEHFFDTLFISYDGQTQGYLEQAAEIWLESKNISHLYVSNTTKIPTLSTGSTRVLQIPTGPPAGPYFVKASSTKAGLDLHQVYRLQKDKYDAFVLGAVAHPKGGWMKTNITLDGDSKQYIPVPSRLTLFKSLPLAGTRFALKDIFDVQYLPTGAGSISYSKTYFGANETAPSVQQLFDLGATLVGKTRTSQFAHGAQPWEYVDIPYSWNPRGDRYLTASASSSGSACAIAGYDWLEFTVGSDTRGSVRKPAAMVGAYGIRPTHGGLDLKGVIPLSEEMDTAGFFTREPRLFTEIAKHWYGNSTVKVKRQRLRFPQKLLYPIEHFPVKNPAAQALYDSFADALKKHLRITKVPVNFTELLNPFFPDGGDFHKFQLESNKLAEYRSWQSVGKPLVQRHHMLFYQDPTYDPVPRQVFRRGARLTQKDFDAAVEYRRRFAESVREQVIKPDAKSCSESLFMYDAGSGGLPSFRVDEYNALYGSSQLTLTAAAPSSKAADHFNYLASMAGLPEITVPIGQVEYYSHITREWEMLPVAVQLVAHAGCDEMLLDLVKKLTDLGIVKPTKTGRNAF